ncbi:hypothetical protein B0J11DRAFT_276573 [Dendryphion nanum]|uniref:Uncharacterized protein n=1 Tax=Dendryphion nanum TaxID=256645 RepID=A0A9P9DYD3_9PLEO|nr:hypothetical protein B0J11DRAFT_276573 [Dendryphion nanum]
MEFGRYHISFTVYNPSIYPPYYVTVPSPLFLAIILTAFPLPLDISCISGDQGSDQMVHFSSSLLLSGILSFLFSMLLLHGFFSFPPTFE